MAGHLSALVQHLCALSDGPVHHTTQSENGEPLVALRHAWAGKWSEALAQAAGTLADDPDHPHRFALYRLWVEALAETRSQSGLKALREHLFLRGQAEPEDHETYAALRGVAHFELDEVNAARLLARSMETCSHNPYCLELVQLVASRAEERPEVPALLRCTKPLTDYCHWQTLSRAVSVAKDEEALNEVLGFVRGHFRGAVLPHVFEFHRCVDSGFFAGAGLVAQRLAELYPDNVDYRYYHAYALFEDGNYPGARQILSEVVRQMGETDPEVVGLLGHTCAKLGDPEKAVHYLKAAVALLKSEGLPTSHISLELANVEEELLGDKLDPAVEMPRQTRNWLVNLSPRRYHEFATSTESGVDRLLRPMGREPRPGDICFFATGARHGQGWRIVGIYAVDSEPMWHPMHRYHSALKLIKRLPDGIPVDVATHEEAGAELPKDKNAPIHFGVYELDNQAIDIIQEAVRLSRDEMIERRSGDGQSRRPTA